MNTTLDIRPAALELAESIALEHHKTLGDVVSDALEAQYKAFPRMYIDKQGFPVIDIGRPLTLEEVRAAIEED